MSRRTAFTLAEVLVAGALATAILGVIVYLFVNFSRQAEKPLAANSMEASTMGIMRWLQRDLSETNLQSLYSLPNESGVVLESARDVNDELVFSAFGTVEWKKFIYYQVKPVAFDKPLPTGVQVGELNYDERLLSGTEDDTLEPTTPTTLTPSGLTSRHRELSRNFLINGTSMGLAVYYMDAGGTARNFTETSRGEPVCVALSLIEVSGRTGQPTIRKLSMQVKPKN